MNVCALMGNIAGDLKLTQLPTGSSVVTFSVAVRRKDASDFIDCVAWNKTAEFICKYFSKGSRIVITGSLHSRTYEDKNGTKHKVTEVSVATVDFGDRKPQEEKAGDLPF